MKKLFLTFVFAIVATLTAMAQQISVVSTTGATSLYRTLQDAIEGADPGSVIYLPGGGFPISDEVKITKKLTIIGIGHYVKSGNVDGITTISGNLFFNDGSSSSAVMGCYISGDVNIGDGGASVNDVLIRYCNLNSVQVKNYTCMGIIANQNYIRNICSFNYSNVTITNNVACMIKEIDGGIVNNNIIFHGWAPLKNIKNSIVQNNIIIGMGSSEVGSESTFSDNIVLGNMRRFSWGENPIVIDVAWNDIFINFNGGAISPASDFHFKEAYKQYENQVGIYAGDGFNDNQLAPVPYIVAKRVDEQTDASGKLNVKIRVKASGEE